MKFEHSFSKINKLRIIFALVIGGFGVSSYAIPPDAARPNDPKFILQWGLEQPNDIDHDAMTAWYMAASVPEPREIVVAVLDTGMDTDHPDLKPRLWRNPGEIAGDGIDNDGNGYIDDINGWDFMEKDSSIFDQIQSHATPVAGNIAAQANNGYSSVGMAGTLPVSIMALPALPLIGPSSLTAMMELGKGVVEALHYAIDNGAHVINLSLALTIPRSNEGADVSPENVITEEQAIEFRQEIRDVINKARAHGVFIVSASLNEDQELMSFPSDYPAGEDWVTQDPPLPLPLCSTDEDAQDDMPCVDVAMAEPVIASIPPETGDHPVAGIDNIIIVTGIDRRGTPVFAWGADVDVAAAAMDVRNITPLRDSIGVTLYTNGTSFATPLVSGIAAMALSVTDLLDKPAAERISLLRNAMMNGVVRMAAFEERVNSGGMINAALVLEELGLSRPVYPAANFDYPETFSTMKPSSTTTCTSPV
jgi:hypothetical protein